MSYSKNHSEDECDKCLRNVGKENLIKVPFIFLDRNDRVHEDLGKINPKLKDYHQYYICENCKA